MSAQPITPAPITLIEAITQALAYELRTDESVVLLAAAGHPVLAVDRDAAAGGLLVVLLLVLLLVLTLLASGFLAVVVGQRLGEDVGVNGGVFRATAGLSAVFGTERVLDTPLDETTIAGLTVGMASQGMKPVAEAQFDGFMYPMMDHIICHAARMRSRAVPPTCRCSRTPAVVRPSPACAGASCKSLFVCCGRFASQSLTSL